MRRLSLTLLLTACTFSGTLDVAVYGEPFIEEGIPADVFVDGWSVTFDRFLVVLGDVSVTGADDAAPELAVFDLAQPSGGAGHLVRTLTLDAGPVDDLAFSIAPSTALVAGTLQPDHEADLARMRDGGYSLYVEGQATRSSDTKRFAWGFKTRTVYAGCDATATVAEGGTSRAEITIHGDHLFYDDLSSETPNVAFDLIAGADADGDGEITEAELRGVDITAEARYQVGDRTDIQDLWSFIEQQTTNVGHIDGEGHCDATRRE